jgi:hypothetical protein
MASAAVAFAPEELLARGRVARDRARIVSGERADVRDQSPALVIIEPVAERGHFGARHAVEHDAIQVGIGVAGRKRPPRQVRTAAPAGSVQAMTASAVHPEHHAPGFNRARVASPWVLARRFRRLGEPHAGKRKSDEELQVIERKRTNTARPCQCLSSRSLPQAEDRG